MAIVTGEYAKASSLMPSKIHLAFDQPKVREVIAAIGLQATKLQIEFELINLAALMSVGGNLNRQQVPFVAEQLIELYPNESIADFKICFRKGAIGAYGEIQRLDGITIGLWMKSYLNEKYEVLESQLMAEKENYYKPVEAEVSNVDWHKKWIDEINAIESKKSPFMDEDEIKRTGQEEPREPIYNTDHAYLLENKNKILKYQEITLRERHPEMNEQQIQDRLNELRDQTQYTTDVEKITKGIFKNEK